MEFFLRTQGRKHKLPIITVGISNVANLNWRFIKCGHGRKPAQKDQSHRSLNERGYPFKKFRNHENHSKNYVRENL